MTFKLLDRFLIVAFSVLAFWSWEIHAQRTPSEYEVKAAFLYNFVKYVEWPARSFANANSPVAIGVLGEDPFGSLLEKAVEGKTVNGRKLTVQRSDQVQNLRACHLLFISRSEKGRLNQLLADVRGAALLTVSEIEKFAERGGMINFQMQADKVRFEINVQAADRAGLKISSKLLNVATVIASEPR